MAKLRHCAMFDEAVGDAYAVDVWGEVVVAHVFKYGTAQPAFHHSVFHRNDAVEFVSHFVEQVGVDRF